MQQLDIALEDDGGDDDDKDDVVTNLENCSGNNVKDLKFSKRIV